MGRRAPRGVRTSATRWQPPNWPGPTRADRLYVTLVLAEVEGDAYFPDVDWDQWRRIDSESHEADDENEFSHVYHVFERDESLKSE